MVDVVTLVDEGLGNNDYLLDLGDGRALVVDPSRDLRELRAAAKAEGCGSRSQPTRTCTPTSCPERSSSRPSDRARCWPRPGGSGSSRTGAASTATRSTSAA